MKRFERLLRKMAGVDGSEKPSKKRKAGKTRVTGKRGKWGAGKKGVSPGGRVVHGVAIRRARPKVLHQSDRVHTPV